MAKRHRYMSSKRRGGSQRAKFARAARTCWSKLRAGKLPRKGQFGKCMKTQLRKRR